MFLRVQAVLVALAAIAVACGDDSGGNSTASVSESFSEGDLRIDIETLDTGLLKGHAFANASEGWVVAAFGVEVTDPGGVSWRVIEPEINGVGGPNVSEFFEVVIQELPRGEQVSVEAVATFQDNSGMQVERRVVDNWPP